MNDPRNQAHFDVLGITQTVCATSGLLGLVEHEVPEHGLVKLLELRGEGLELVELHVPPDAPAAGKRVAGISLPEGAKLVSLMRNGVGEIVRDETVIRPGDQIVAILKPGVEDRLRRAVVGLGRISLRRPPPGAPGSHRPNAVPPCWGEWPRGSGDL